MGATIRGSFPGGPRKSVPAAARETTPRLKRVEEIEERAATRHLRRRAKNRFRRGVYGMIGSLVVAGALGMVLGLRSHTTAESLRLEAAEEAAPTVSGEDLSAEVNRTLLELWKMEDVEFYRNSR